jgi:hypothetical protein
MMGDLTNHTQIFNARMHYFNSVKKKKSISEAEFERWLWDNWQVVYKGWGSHMTLMFESTEHEVLFRLTWA